jgi:hypothetical protein
MRFVTGLAALSAAAVLSLPVAAAAADMRGVTATRGKRQFFLGSESVTR